MGFSKESERGVIIDTFNYTYENNQTIEEPPEGFIRVNQTYPQDSTIMAFSAIDNLGQNVGNSFELFDNGEIVFKRGTRTLTVRINSITDHNTWFEIEFTVLSGSLYRRGRTPEIPQTGDEWSLSLSSFFDSFKFDTIGENDGTPWRSFTTSGSGGIGQGGLDYCVVGINLKEEIEKKWGSVDTSNYMYTVGLGLKRTNANGTKCHILGFSSFNSNPAANNLKDIGATSFGIFNFDYQFEGENGGLFCGSALYDVNGTFNQAGAIQSKSYFGTTNNAVSSGLGNYIWDFANETPITSGTAPITDPTKPPGFANRGRLYQDLGNCSTIRTAASVGSTIAPQTLTRNETTYFWFSFSNELQGQDYFPYRTDATTSVFLGQGFDTPYFNIFKNAYPNSILNFGGSPQVGLIAPASTSRTQLDESGKQPVNSYYDADQTFDELTTFIFRVKLIPDDIRAVWFHGGNVNGFDGNYSNSYITTTFSNIEARNLVNNYGFKFYRYCKYGSWINWSNNIIGNVNNSRMWNDNFNVQWERTIIPSGGSQSLPDDDLQAVKGVGNYLFMARKNVGHCFNLDRCQTEPSYFGDPVPCTTTENANTCLSSVDPTMPGALGWDAAENLNAYCVRFPEDPLCGCANTVNNENIVDFIRILEEETGIDLANYCFSKACTDPSLDAWIDPRNNPDNCPSDLQFCITLIDIAGNNNVIQDTDIYQDCSNLVGDRDNGGGGSGGASSTTWIIVGAILGVLIIGLVIFFIVRNRGK